MQHDLMKYFSYVPQFLVYLFVNQIEKQVTSLDVFAVAYQFLFGYVPSLTDGIHYAIHKFHFWSNLIPFIDTAIKKIPELWLLRVFLYGI